MNKSSSVFEKIAVLEQVDLYSFVESASRKGLQNI